MELQAKVERIHYPPPNQDGDWYIIKTDKGTVKGTMSWRPDESEPLKLEGDWTVYQGRKEFKFKSARADLPISPEAQLKYVCEMTKGVGYAIERRIYDQWGDEWTELIEPDVVKGLNGRTFERFRDTLDQFKTKREMAEAVAWLMDHNLTVTMAQAAWTKWEKEVIGVVKADCYRLTELTNFGFANVDKSIRHAFEIGDTDPRRIRAAVEYSMKQMTANGSTIVNWYPLKDHTQTVLGGVQHQLIVDCVRGMIGDGALVAFPESRDIALQRDHENAQIVFEFITKKNNEVIL